LFNTGVTSWVRIAQHHSQETHMGIMLDRALAILLIIGAGGGHVAGSIAAYRHQPLVLLWSLGVGALGVLIGVVNLLRSFRPGDAALAWLGAATAAAWLALDIAFGVLIGHVLDARVLGFAVIALGLLAFSLQGVLTRTGKAAPGESARPDLRQTPG
jgi:hypothetical protein